MTFDWARSFEFPGCCEIPDFSVQVVYWDDKEKKEGNEFELTEKEINIDIQEENPFIKDTTKLDHSYTTF